MPRNPTAGLDGPSRTIVVEPTKQPTQTPQRRDAPERPTPAPAPAAPDREKVPA